MEICAIKRLLRCLRFVHLSLFLLCLFTGSTTLFFYSDVLAQQRKDTSIRSRLHYRGADLRDPFMDYLPKEKEIKISKVQEEKEKKERKSEEILTTLSSFSVQGIAWGGKLPQAIIDGTVVKIGDIIKEAEVIDIDKEGVTLIYNDRRYKIPAPAYTSPEATEGTAKEIGGEK